MPQYTYRFSHEERISQTFSCEGCGQRYPLRQLYNRANHHGPPGLRRHLDRGEFCSGTVPHRLYVTVCSAACLQRAPKRTWAELCTHFALPYPEHQRRRPYGPRVRKDTYV